MYETMTIIIQLRLPSTMKAYLLYNQFHAIMKPPAEAYLKKHSYN